MKRGMGAKPILKSDIEIAQKNTLSAAAAAKYLNVAYNTYKKWAMYYGVWKTNPHSIGIKKANRGRFQIQEDVLKEVLEGKRPNYNRFRLKSLLIKYGFLHEECSQCGYNEQRITDKKVPLILVFNDGDKKNFKAENLRLLCFNCYFLTVGDINGHKIEYTYYKD
jgi:hypothetical protein